MTEKAACKASLMSQDEKRSCAAHQGGVEREAHKMVVGHGQKVMCLRPDRFCFKVWHEIRLVSNLDLYESNDLTFVIECLTFAGKSAPSSQSSKLPGAMKVKILKSTIGPCKIYPPFPKVPLPDRIGQRSQDDKHVPN